MIDPWRRLALALLVGFGSFVLAVPVACGGLLIYSQHIYGDVQMRGPESILGAMAMAAILALLITVWVFIRSSPKP